MSPSSSSSLLLLLAAAVATCAAYPQYWSLRDKRDCPPVTERPAHECVGRQANCWSPGVRDTDCPAHGLCCFDGCVASCVDAQPPYRPTPPYRPSTPAPTKKPHQHHPKEEHPHVVPPKPLYPQPEPNYVEPPQQHPHQPHSPHKEHHHQHHEEKPRSSYPSHKVPVLPPKPQQSYDRHRDAPKRAPAVYPVHSGRVATSCPAAPIRSPYECGARTQHLCWSPGHADTDCPSNGLCCFDGCINRCVGSAPPVVRTTPRPPQNPCQPSPCGPGTTCSVNRDGNPVCQCKPGLIPRPDTIAGCDVECHVDPDCAYGNVCIRNSCVPRPDPCNPSPCGPGTTCVESRDGNPVCNCLPGLVPQPDTITGCGPECRVDPDCASKGYGLICQNQKCVPRPDPCNPSPCGPRTTCIASRDGNPVCRCQPGFVPKPDTITGCGHECTQDHECYAEYGRDYVCEAYKCVPKPDPCHPSPCGPGTTCHMGPYDNAVCECLPGLIPKPDTVTGCGPECTTDYDCGQGFICQNQRCVEKPDPCDPSPCGPGAFCEVINGNAICKCEENKVARIDTIVGCDFECTTDYECHQDFGKNFLCQNYRCVEKPDPCNPSPCGPGAICTVHPVTGNPVCKCEPNKIPLGDTIQGCDYECRVDRDCGHDHECLNYQCSRKKDPCQPNPCGMMAECSRRGDNYECTCPRGTFGDAYAGCQQGECLTDDDCQLDKACFEFFCVNPCLTNSTCRAQDFCQVRNHIPVCGYNFDEPPKVRTPIVIGGRYEPAQPAQSPHRPFVIGGKYEQETGGPTLNTAEVIDARRSRGRTRSRAIGGRYRRKKRQLVNQILKLNAE